MSLCSEAMSGLSNSLTYLCVCFNYQSCVFSQELRWHSCMLVHTHLSLGCMEQNLLRASKHDAAFETLSLYGLFHLRLYQAIVVLMTGTLCSFMGQSGKAKN